MFSQKKIGVVVELSVTYCVDVHVMAIWGDTLYRITELSQRELVENDNKDDS